MINKNLMRKSGLVLTMLTLLLSLVVPALASGNQSNNQVNATRKSV